MRVHAAQPWQDAQHHIRRTEDHMGDADGSQSLAEAQRDEQQEERDTGDDIRVNHRHGIEEGDHFPLPRTHIIDTYRRERP